MVTLKDLEAHFLQYIVEGERIYYKTVDTLNEAHGVSFLCPKCFEDNHGPIGTHHVICWFVGKVPDSAYPKPGRWNPSGTGLDDLTFVPCSLHQQFSVLLTGGCNWHGYIKKGTASPTP